MKQGGDENSQEGAEVAGRIGQGRIWFGTAEVGSVVGRLRRAWGASATGLGNR